MLNLKDYIIESIMDNEEILFNEADVELFLKTNYKIIGSYTINTCELLSS